MGPDEVHTLVVVTGRLSATLFVAALCGAVLPWRAVQLWVGFLSAHTIHFAAVLSFAILNKGRDLFPGGMSLADAGGWPALAASATFFYSLAVTNLVSMRRGPRAGRWLRLAGPIAASLIGSMFLATYMPLVGISAFFAIPVLAVSAALVTYLWRTFRRPMVPS